MINKNVTVWRGDDTPPTNYHVWIKEDGTILVNIANRWKTIISDEILEGIGEVNLEPVKTYLTKLQTKDFLLSNLSAELRSDEVVVNFLSLDLDDFLSRPMAFSIPEATNTESGVVNKNKLEKELVEDNIASDLDVLDVLNS